MTLSEHHPLSEDDLTAFIDGQLEPTAAAEAATHIWLCASCSAALAEARRLSAEMKEWTVEEAPAWIAENVREQLPPKTTKRRVWNIFREWRFALAGAVGLVGILIGIGYFAVNGSRGEYGLARRLAESQTAETAAASDGHADMVIKKAQVNLPQRMESSLGAADAAKVSAYVAAAAAIAQQATSSGPGTAPLPESYAPMLIRSAKLTVITKDFDDARAQMETVVRTARGYVDDLSVSGKKGKGRSLSAKLRIPSIRFDDGLKALRTLGQPQNELQSSDDVSRQFADLNARLANSRNTEQRLLAIVRE